MVVVAAEGDNNTSVGEEERKDNMVGDKDGGRRGPSMVGSS